MLGGDGIPADVIGVLFEGERYALRLKLGDGQLLRAYSRTVCAEGDRVAVTISAGWRL